MKQPLSVFSNAFYLYPAFEGIRSSSLSLQLVGVANLVLACGSGLYHYWHQVDTKGVSLHTAGELEYATKAVLRTIFWRDWDHRGMYLVLAACFGRVAELAGTDPTIAVVGGLAVGITFSIFARRLNLFHITGALVAANVVAIAVFLSWQKAALALGLFLAAFAVRQLTDVAGRVESGAEDRGHAVWHLLTSLAIDVILTLTPGGNYA